MDAPDVPPVLHRQALRALRRINRLSRTSGLLWSALRGLASPAGARPLRVLDVACGGGDVAIELAQRAAAAGVSLEVAGCDLSPTAVAHAREQAAEAGVEGGRFFPLDVLREPLPEGFDVACCSLFLHHLAEEEIVALLKQDRKSVL